MLFTIDKIQGNSGQGSALFSRSGLMGNTNHMVYNKESTYERPKIEETQFDYKKWSKEIKEYECMIKFEKVMEKRKQRDTRQEHQMRLGRLGVSRTLDPRGSEDSE